MKKIFYLMIGLMTMIAFSSCQKDEPTPQPQQSFTIEVSDVAATTATVTVTPSDTAVAYYFDVLTKAEYDSLGESGLHAYYEDYFEYAIEYYSYYGYDITVADLLSTGVDSYGFESLTPSTEYVALAFVYDSAAVSSVTTKAFTTSEVQASAMTIDFTVNDTAIYITPSTDDETYFVSYESTDTIAAYGYTAVSYATALYAYMVDYYGSYFSYYCEYEGPVYLPLSSVTEDVTLFACGSTSGNQTTDWFTYEYQVSGAAATAPRRAPRKVSRPAAGNIGNLWVPKTNMFKR